MSQGFKLFMVETIPTDAPADCAWVVVPNTLRALQQLGTNIRKAFGGKVLAIGGSNGKTIVKEWLFQLVHQKYKTVRSPRSYNSQVGVPLSLWQLLQHADVALLEAGISEPGEMELLQQMILPEGGVFTNLGSAHDAQFIHRAQKMAEKAALYRHCQWVVFRNDRNWSDELSALLPDATKRITWRMGPGDATLVVDNPTRSGQGQIIQGTYKGKAVKINVPFTGEQAAENAIHAWLMAVQLGLKPDELPPLMARLEPVSMRQEMVEGRNQCMLINDGYNSDLESLRAALTQLKLQAAGKQKVLIISDLLQTGMPDQELYAEVAAMVNNAHLDAIYAVGTSIGQRRSLFPGHTRFFVRTDDLLAELQHHPPHDAAILLKGARIFKFEGILDLLRKKAHQTALEIDLAALEANLRYFQGKLQPGVKLMVMTKAFSYGVGALEVAQLLEKQGVDYIAVAYSDEGVQLREQGITLPIMVMNPDPEALIPLIGHRLEPEIFNLKGLKSFGKMVLEVLPGATRYPVHLKLETGMNRLGFDSATLKEALALLDEMPWLEIKSVFSHLAAAEDPNHNAFTQQQIKTFAKLAGKVEKWMGQPVLKHILNTAGIQHHPDGQFDMVRLGLGLYGVSPVPEEASRLRPVARLTTAISQIKNLEPGDSVGYGRSFIASTPMRSATLPIGYADGFDRRLSNGKGQVYIHGQAAPVLGRVCMDMIMVDVTHIDCQEGDTAEIFGQHQSIAQLAEAMNTIPYEVLTGLSSRIKRVYYRE